MVYLCGCVVNGRLPGQEHLRDVNPEYLYQAAGRHQLHGIVGYALESAGVFDHEFIQSKAKAIRKVAAMEIDKGLLFDRFEQKKIWYLPLKGVVLKDLYPSIGMRQMGDFDILYDSRKQKQVREIFLELGFTCEHFGRGTHDVYYKKPVSNFEMHTALFGSSHKTEFYEYYRDVQRLMRKDANNQYGYHFSSSDMYVYIVAHEYKHFSWGGTGLRSLLDTYVIWQKLGDEMDADYIRLQTDQLGITDFEQKNKQLALDLFGGKTLSEEQQELLEYIAFSGTYGSVRNNIENKVKEYGGGRKGKRKYILSRLFPSMEEIKAGHPFFYRHKLLLPGLFFYRLGRAVTVSRRNTKTQLKRLQKTK